MKIQLIRNATMKITYSGEIFLCDPMLSDKGMIRSFAGKEKNPTIDLPFSIDKVLEGITSVLISHTHPDHFDDTAAQVIDKKIPVLCQPGNKKALTKNFDYVISIQKSYSYNGINITRIGGSHGTGLVKKLMGKVSGFILKADNEPTIYWAGDTVWCKDVENALIEHKPDIVITHSGNATIPGFRPILMDDNETLAVFDILPKSKVIAIHMESLDHCTVTRKMLRDTSEKQHINKKQLYIPENGEVLSF